MRGHHDQSWSQRRPDSRRQGVTRDVDVGARVLICSGALVAVYWAGAGAFGDAPRQRAIPGVIAAGEVVELVQEGYVNLEGPVGTPEGGLYFTDTRADRVYLMAPDGTISIAREETRSANGLAFTRGGDLVAAEYRGGRIVRLVPQGATETLTAGAAERTLMAPNDLIVDDSGGIYFTDPGPRPVVQGRVATVYYLPAGSTIPKILDERLPRPNGIALSLDGKTLLVGDTLGRDVYAYEMASQGEVARRRVFATLKDIPPGQESVADGMAIDDHGRLYVSTLTGVQVFDAASHYLGTIVCPRQPANVAFSGPDKRTLYITARQGLYRVRLLSRGPSRLGK